MGGSRTVKTLTALFVSMTFGALTLMLMETEPISARVQSLSSVAPPPAGAAEIVYDTVGDVRDDKWTYVVVHSTLERTSPTALACHFIVDQDKTGAWRVLATENWRKQRSGEHVAGYWKSHSVGVCVVGDFSQRQPTREQFDCLIDLVNALQEVCRIPADRVYLISDLDARSMSPGRFFPAARFSARLLRQGS